MLGSILFPGLGACPIVSVSLCLVAPPLFQWTRVAAHGFSEAFATELFTTSPDGPVPVIRDLVITVSVDEVGTQADFRVDFGRAATVWRVASAWGRPALLSNWLAGELIADAANVQAVIDSARDAARALDEALAEEIAERFALEDAGDHVAGCRAC